jgi:cytochrome oxidase Cu insertion factor (SCO1/SenC/PrrC family)
VQRTTTRLRLALIFLSVSCLPALAISQPSSDRSAAELMDVVMWNREPIGGPFALTDQNGALRTEADFRGNLMLVYFGFTHCPDVCPSDLSQMALVVDQLGQAGQMVQPIFITVDPERDTPEHLKPYLLLFHQRFIGLSGDAVAIQVAARAYRAYYKKVELDDRPDYTIDHSTFMYLMGRDGDYLGFFPPGTSAEQIAEVIKPHLAANR